MNAIHHALIPHIPFAVKAPIAIVIAGFAFDGILDPTVAVMSIVWFGYEIAVNPLAKKHCKLISRFFVGKECHEEENDCPANVDEADTH